MAGHRDPSPSGAAVAAPADRPPAAAGRRIDLASLAAVRAFVHRHGQAYGLAGDVLDDFVMAVHELATNVIRHGGGTGRVWIWCASGTVYCQVVDGGPGIEHPERYGHAPSAPAMLTGRGLWMVRRLVDRVGIASGPAGATVTVATRPR